MLYLPSFYALSAKDASMFLTDPKAVLCYTVSPRGTSEQTAGVWIDDRITAATSAEAVAAAALPVVILQNEGTASAAEVFIAALRDNHRAQAVIGTRSYGKSLIQHFFPLPNGGAVKLTVAEYLTPKKQHIVRNVLAAGEEGGLAPDSFCSDQVAADPRQDLCVLMGLNALSSTTSSIYK